MSTDLAALLAQRFIQRKDVKAVQVADGGYRPDRTPWKMKDLRDHIAGTVTHGHYLCDQSSKVKLFVLDIDLEENSERTGFHGNWVQRPDLASKEADKYFDEMRTQQENDGLYMSDHVIHPANPRVDWRNRNHPGREWWKYQMRSLADILTSRIRNDLKLPCAAAYSGYKGLHVYGFTGECDAADARALAMATLELAAATWLPTGEFVPTKGENFFKYRHNSGNERFDAIDGYDNLAIEVYPKQETMEGKDLGNLVRLPMGVNQKSGRLNSKTNKTVFDPAFFIDQLGATNTIAPHPNPQALLEEGDPFRRFES